MELANQAGGNDNSARLSRCGVAEPITPSRRPSVMRPFHPPASEAPGSTSSSLLGRVVAAEPEAWARDVPSLLPLGLPLGPPARAPGRGCGRRGSGSLPHARRAPSALFHRDQPGDSFRGWLWAITHNKLRTTSAVPCHHAFNAVNSKRRRNLLQQHPEPSADGKPSDAGGFEVETSLLHRAMEIIKPEF